MITASFLIGFFLQLSFSGTFVMLANMMTGRGDAPAWYPIIFAAYGLIIFFVNMFFLKKQRTFTSLFTLNGSLGVATIAGALIIGRSFSFWNITATLVSVGALTVIAIMSLIAEPSLRICLFGFETAVVLIIIFAVMVASTTAKPIWIIPGAIGMALAQGALMIKRIGRIPTVREGALIAAVIIVMFTLASVFAFVAAAPAGGGLMYVLGLILTGLKQLGKWIVAFMAWLSSFFKEGEAGELPPPMPGMENMNPSEQVEPVKSFALIALILAGIVIVIVLFFILKMFGRNKYDIRMKEIGGLAPLKRDKPSFRNALKKLIEDLKLKARKRRFLMEYRNTAVGLYYSMELAFSHGKNRKISGESPREFLDRICLACPCDVCPDKDAIFDRLKDKVDGALYGSLEMKEKFTDHEMVRKIIGAVK